MSQVKAGQAAGSTILGPMAPPPPARGATQDSKGNTLDARGASPLSRSSGRCNHMYAFSGRSKAKASDAIIT
ncbi:hypothetical protein HAX54_022374, partial [Datura stramonium]|nr:hypothetical protein [Datura stramonium]